jgi:hypothetical protein
LLVDISSAATPILWKLALSLALPFKEDTPTMLFATRYQLNRTSGFLFSGLHSLTICVLKYFGSTFS